MPCRLNFTDYVVCEEMVRSNHARNTGNRKRNIRYVSGAHYGFLRLFGLSSLTLSISERCEKWVKQCIKRSRQLGIHT